MIRKSTEYFFNLYYSYLNNYLLIIYTVLQCIIRKFDN